RTDCHGICIICCMVLQTACAILRGGGVMSEKRNAIIVEDVKKNFLLPHERNNSIKQSFTQLFKKKDRSIEVQHALRGVSFSIKEGEFFGILGRNGSGKSTMLKMLAGIYTPSSGRVRHF